jgi:2-polyprenyl-6-methoxyphenol hydroxylase-like FAD-dependent oxidoreductase
MSGAKRGGVLVVGGGVAGFAMARALSLRGVPCELVERLAAPASPGTGLNLPGNAIRALAALGVAEAVIQRGVPIRRREYRNGQGRLLFAVDETAFWDAVGTSVGVRRGHLLDVLRASAAEVRPRWGTAVVHADQSDADVRIRLESGAVETYDFVVAADGVHSALRPAVNSEDGQRLSLMTDSSWRFIVPNPGVDCWTVWSGSSGTFLLMPVDDGHLYGYASSTRGGAASADPQWLSTTFAGFPEPVLATLAALLDNPDRLYYSPVEEVRCERWSRGRLVLIGDAAHATGPVWAQGAALALEDALVLADLLAAQHDWSSVGAQFERLRRPRVAHVQAATDKMSRIAGLPSRLRDLVAPVLGPRAYRAAYGPLRNPVTTDAAQR